MRVVSPDVIEDSSQTRVISSELRYPSRWRRIHALRGADQPVQKVPSRDGHPGYNSPTIQSRWEINVSDPRKCESNPGKHESCPTTTMPSRPADQSGLTASCFTSELATTPGITVNTTAIPGRARFVTATY